MTEFERLKEMAANGILTMEDIENVVYNRSSDGDDIPVIKLIFLTGQRRGSNEAFDILSGKMNVEDLKPLK